MIYTEKKLILRNGKEAIFRSPAASDAPEMLEYLKRCAAETDFLLRYPEEWAQTVAGEAYYLLSINKSDTAVMTVCTVDGRIAGNCQIQFHDLIKLRHRAVIGIVILQQYWGIGIGTAMISEMISIAKARGILQLELNYAGGNKRAEALYKKMGFIRIGEHPNALRLKSGVMLNEISMIRSLE